MKKATIKFSQNPEKYLPAVLTRWEGVELYNYSPLIYAYNEKNIAITGEGTLDGQGITNIGGLGKEKRSLDGKKASRINSKIAICCLKWQKRTFLLKSAYLVKGTI